jgi:hypothetical protein
VAYAAWLGIVGLTVAIAALAVASAAGILDTGVARRLVGMGLGLMMLLTGNLLPKLRPLTWLGGNARTGAVERLSGWLLALAGIAWVALFALAPLSEARQVAALIGMAAVLIIGVRWAWMAGRAWLQHDSGPPVSGYAAKRWQLVGWLLFAVFYVVVIACVKYLVEQQQLAYELSMWVLAVFWLGYAALSFAFGHRDGRRC